MRFLKGVRYPHPPRGLGRRGYHVSDAARQARRRNLSNSRLRSARESHVIKLLIWQSCFEGGPRLSQRALARQLGVYPSYVWKIQRQAEGGLDAVAIETRATFDDLDNARRFTAELRTREPGILPPRIVLPPIRHTPIAERPDPQSGPVTVPCGIEGHGWNCECAGCRVKRVIETVRQEAKGPEV